MKNRKISSADKILFVSSYNLYKRFGGGLATLAFFQATNALFPEKVDIILPKESYESNKSNYFKAPKRNKIMAAILLIFGRLHRYRNYVSLHLKQYHGRYKWCVINGGIYAGDMIKRIKSYGIKVIVIHHNYEKEYHSDNKTLVSFYGKFPYYVIRNERNAYHQADLNLFLTKSDMESFVENYGECKSICCVIGMFEYEYRTVQFIKEIKLPHKIIITVSMSHNQTIYGIIDFYYNYYPIICRDFHDVKVIISGRSPSAKILSIAEQEKNNITVIANPENMEDVIAMGTIYCCPTNIGGGLKLRVMDGLRQGLPVLVHKVSSRGYDVFFDKPYFRIYSDKETFREGFDFIIRLYFEGKINHAQIQNDYNKYFSFESGCKRLKECLSFLIDKE